MNTANEDCITEEERADAHALAARLGDGGAARAVGLDLASFLRVLLGRRVRRGTIVLLRSRLSELKERTATPSGQTTTG